jgi:hypothetical protein
VIYSAGFFITGGGGGAALCCAVRCSADCQAKAIYAAADCWSVACCSAVGCCVLLDCSMGCLGCRLSPDALAHLQSPRLRSHMPSASCCSRCCFRCAIVIHWLPGVLLLCSEPRLDAGHGTALLRERQDGARLRCMAHAHLCPLRTCPSGLAHPAPLQPALRCPLASTSPCPPPLETLVNLACILAVLPPPAVPLQYCLNLSAPFICEVPPFKKALTDLMPFVDYLFGNGGLAAMSCSPCVCPVASSQVSGFASSAAVSLSKASGPGGRPLPEAELPGCRLWVPGARGS